MERPSKRVQMTLPPQHPVAELLDEAFKAFFLKREQRLRPMPQQEPFNMLAQMRRLNELNDLVATHSDFSVYADLPHNLQGLVRQFTPHPVSLLLEEARFVCCELKHLRSNWPREQACRLAYAEYVRDKHVRVAHFEWLQDRGNYGAWRRSDVTVDDFDNDDDTPRGYPPTTPYDYEEGY